MVVYYDSLQACDDEIFLAATKKGLCFISNDYNEMVEWLAKRKLTDIRRSKEEMANYTKIFKQYFQGEAIDFTTLAVDVVGTDFQLAVWQQLRNIQYGETYSYSDVAIAINQPLAVRAVASAIGKNPLLIVIPCHRVIGKNGKLTGFRSGLPLKEQLLKIEGITFN